MTGKHDLCAAIYGHGADLVLIPLPVDERSRLAMEYLAEHDLPFCGQMSYVNGESSARCEKSAEAVETMMHAVMPFANYLAARLRETEHRLQTWRELT
jgi:hypothetical protein